MVPIQHFDHFGGLLTGHIDLKLLTFLYQILLTELTELLVNFRLGFGGEGLKGGALIFGEELDELF